MRHVDLITASDSQGMRRRIRGARLARDRPHISSFLNYVLFLPFEATPDDMMHGLNYPPRSGPLCYVTTSINQCELPLRISHSGDSMPWQSHGKNAIETRGPA
jgi:hypothetical protein